jgi:hypothetical protein
MELRKRLVKEPAIRAKKFQCKKLGATVENQAARRLDAAPFRLWTLARPLILSRASS